MIKAAVFFITSIVLNGVKKKEVINLCEVPYIAVYRVNGSKV